MKKITIALFVLILIITILAGVGGYWYFIQSQEVTKEINLTVDIVNTSSQQSTDLQNQITKSVLKLSEKAEYEQTVVDLIQIVPKSQDFINQKQAKKDQINQNSSTRTMSLTEQAIVALDVHSEALTRSLEVASFAQCVGQNLNTQFVWMQELGGSWDKTNENTSELTFIQLNRQTAEKLRENVDTAPRIRDCFVGQYDQLFTLEYENSMKKDVSIYRNLADNMDKLATSVERFNRTDFLAAKDDIIATLSQQSTFIGDTQLKIRDAIDKVASENAGEMRTQYELIDRSKIAIEKKWWL
jgi:hypothetical protein